MSWTCPTCERNFKSDRQKHDCGDRSVADFLKGKNENVVALFDHFLAKYAEIGQIKLQTTKVMIALANKQRFAYIIQIGKSFIDIVFPFGEPFTENLCFRKIVLVPRTTTYHHHLRLMFAEDINEEVFTYMQKAYHLGKNI